MSTWDGWWSVFMYCIGAPMNAHNKKFLLAWHRCEGGDARFNPLNTTQPMPGSTYYNVLARDANGKPTVGVQNYLTRRSGNDAHVKTISQRKYAEIVALLQKGNAPFADLAHAVGTSDWGTSEKLLKEVLKI